MPEMGTLYGAISLRFFLGQFSLSPKILPLHSSTPRPTMWNGIRSVCYDSHMQADLGDIWGTCHFYYGLKWEDNHVGRMKKKIHSRRKGQIWMSNNKTDPVYYIFASVCM